MRIRYQAFGIGLNTMKRFSECILRLVHNILLLAASAVGCFVFVRGFSLVASVCEESGALYVPNNTVVPKLLASVRVALFILASSTARAVSIIQAFYR